jgi:hypothetical protein
MSSQGKSFTYKQFGHNKAKHKFEFKEIENFTHIKIGHTNHKKQIKEHTLKKQITQGK